MEFEILNAEKGDKEKSFDSSEAGRKEAVAFFEKMKKRGTALFLMRGKKNYRIKAYDPKTDRIMVEVEKKGKTKTVTAKGAKSKGMAVPPVAGGADESYAA